MKKTIILFCIIFFCIILIICMSLIQNKKNIENIQKENATYEEYKGKTVFGTEVASIINKAINTNTKNEIGQDDEGFFIENDINSIEVEIKLLYEGTLKTYQMETINKVGTEGFIENFNLILFKCTNIDYHEKTNKVSKIVFEQVEE